MSIDADQPKEFLAKLSRDYFNLGRVLEGVLRSPRSLSALSPMLIDLARACGGFGATLWRLRWIDTEDAEEPTPRTLPETWEEATRNRLGLYVVGQGMERRPHDREAALRCAYEALTLQHASGLAVLEGNQCIVAEDCDTDPRVAKDTAFHREIRPGSTMATRVRFEDGSWGAVTLYRRTKGTLAPELNYLFRELAGYAPIMYAMLMDRIGLALVEYVSGTLDQTQEGVDVVETLSPICAKLAEFLECHEVSIFLESAVVPGVAELRATTRLDMIRRQEYRPEDSGFTPYVLRSKRPIRVFDLLKAPKEITEKAKWDGRAQVESQVRRDLGAIPEDEYPPVSFAAVPILAQDRVVGVLRCRWRRGSPYYFSDMDIDVLKIAAGRLGVYWMRQQLLEASQSAAASWQRFADRLNALPLRFSPSVRSAEGNEAFQQAIFKAVLSATQASISGADILDIARPDAARRFFVPVVTEGKEWDAPGGSEARRKAKLPVKPQRPMDQNSWARCFSDQRPIYVRDAMNPPADADYKRLFPEAKQALFVPITAEGESIGVLSIRSKTRFGDEEEALRMASLGALVIALYYRLTVIVTEQAQTYQDLEHQLRTPVFQARKRASLVLDENRQDDLTYDLQAINGLLARANRVLRNMRIFETLAAQHPVVAERVSLNMAALLKSLGEMAKDHSILWKDKRMEFVVDRSSFEKTKVAALPLDATLMEQAINNLLDNAGKYGKIGSRVSIVGTLDGRRLRIAVENEAEVHLLSGDIEHIGRRFFRAAAAVRRAAEGAGLGLYIVKNLVEAHKGELLALPTNPLGLTSISIFLPLEERK